MKNKIIVANWKMALTLKETKSLTKELIEGLAINKNLEQTKIILCPSFISLSTVNDLIKESSLPFCLGAQNIFWEEGGAYTGEISALMLREIDVEYVILGHSERRAYFNETDEIINKKIKTCFKYGLKPIICVGETAEEKEMKQEKDVVSHQLRRIFEGVNLIDKDQFVVAYEPIWAVGSGLVINPKKAEEAHEVIEKKLENILPTKIVKNNSTVIYGGSIDAQNIAKFLDVKIDGYLIGGSSLKSNDFIKIINTLSFYDRTS
ncbi:MAG: triose-phosphate isomerase [Bacteroidetes bacterium]|nr:triose-phosphate isomerase [Bacteroidota bacterium]